MNRNVTLIVFEGVKSRHSESEKLFKYICSLGDFGDAVFIRDDCNYKQAMQWEIGVFYEYVKTSHALICTHDGFISNPNLWKDSWLKYDLIGSPWPEYYNVNNRVGNTGFSLQSKNFLEVAKSHRELWNGEAGDVFLCQIMYDKFRELGINYADVNVASEFGWEHYIEENTCGPNISFGFHGWVAGKTKEHYYIF